MEEAKICKFKSENLGDINLGRPNLGATAHVAVYRLMQYTMREVMEKHLGTEKSNSRSDRALSCLVTTPSRSSQVIATPT